MSKSERLFSRAKKVIPSGINSPVRYYDPYPFFVKKADGSTIWDVDGNQYIDYCNGYGALLLGHGRKEVINNVLSQLKKRHYVLCPNANRSGVIRINFKEFSFNAKDTFG